MAMMSVIGHCLTLMHLFQGNIRDASSDGCGGCGVLGVLGVMVTIALMPEIEEQHVIDQLQEGWVKG